MRQVGGLLEPGQQRHEHRAHRPRVDRPVRRAARLPVHRAHVQARAAADAREHLVIATAGELRPAVVEDHDVQLVGPVLLALAARPGDQRRVRRSAAAPCRFARAAAATRRGRLSEATSRSIPMSATWTRGRLDTSRPLPSFVTRTIEPVSQTPKFAPVMPTSARMERLAQLAPRGLRQLRELGGDRLTVDRATTAPPRPPSSSRSPARRCARDARPRAGGCTRRGRSPPGGRRPPRAPR